MIILNTWKLRHFIALTTFCCLCLLNSLVLAKVSPWCDETGNPQHPLSIERMSQGPLFLPKVRANPGEALQAILDAFDRAQSTVNSNGDLSSFIPEAKAFRRILQIQISGKNIKPYFQFSMDLRTGNAKLFWPVENMKVVFDCENETPLKLQGSNPQKANIGYATYLVFTVLSKQLQALDGYYNKRLTQRADEYHRFMTKGMPMWPWELAINGWGESYEDLLKRAPKWQWVVARPSAGFEVYWPNRKQANLEASIGIEPIGFIRYTDDSYKNWWGVSTLVTLGTDDQGVGLGGLIRYKNYSLGIVKRKDIDDHFLFFSIDLYDKLRTEKIKIKEAKGRLEELKQSWKKY